MYNEDNEDNEEIKNDDIKNVISIKALLIFLVCILVLIIVGNVFSKPKENGTKTENITSFPRNTVIFESDVAKVTVKEVENDEFTYEVTNCQDEGDIMFSVDGVAVNGCAVYEYGHSTMYITPGNRDNQKYNISAKEAYGITQIDSLEIKYSIYDYHKEEYRKERSCISSLQNAGTAFFPQIEGEKIYSDENVDIFTVKKGESIKDIDLLFCNKTDRPITAEFFYLAINGIMSDFYNYYGGDVPANGYLYTGAVYDNYVTLWSAADDEIKEKGFDHVEKIDGKLQIVLDPDNDDSEFYTVEKVAIFE